MNKYVIAIDMGYQDETVAMLGEIKKGKLYIIEEKRSGLTGDKKITEKQRENIHITKMLSLIEENPEKMLEKEIPKILGWEKYKAKVVIDLKKKMKRSEFEKLFEDRIKENAIQSIRENEDERDGYRGPVEEYEDEIFTNNFDQYVDEYAEMLGVELE